jgi:glycosyltransferase involved in cell wall biosynthesis
VLPYSRMYTGSSGPLYDAVAHGRPLIASDVSEMGHLISEHGLGECVPPESPAQLADAIRRFLAASPSERTALERRVMDFARNHTPAAVAGQYERLFRAVANRQSVANDCAA